MKFRTNAVGLVAGAGYRMMQAALPVQPEISPERDAALWALASRAGETGWTIPALRDSAGPDADLLFPGGRAELIEAWADLIDREMLRRMEEAGSEEQRLSWRVRQAVLTRLAILESYRAAERRAVACVSSPCAGGAAGRIMTRTLNTIWVAAGDDASGVTWITKRISLAGVYMPAFLSWLGGADRDTVERVLDSGLTRVRRIGDVKRILSSRPVARAA
ncbi:ubiquinone biosynthesis protein COQ9 [Acetobacter fallax]|uniref:COQ9 C-terminal domain-containing protein n=1 Tax=Acetobacter fallax TaxID=1737473 RepID=A0ABX0KCK8_9PROT|nr:hypothetical protein [Acetobacter fallax]NHO34177.1 hypothetical protein [Acetobacter fallax]NHO37719.1 hypothetical protein [Acetobacter fallax]